ncbi:MAG: hypothetical protein Q7S22_02315 [Candidatus Micrarchaeota archaeon]|nr:hypothetical protein [Candidatus Micrarchaeota archaeon]
MAQLKPVLPEEQSSKLHDVTPVKTFEELPTWQKMMGYAVGTILSPVIAVGLIMGCGEECKVPPKDTYIWFPAVQIKDGKNLTDVSDVSLGIYVRDGQPLAGLTGYFQSPEKIYTDRRQQTNRSYLDDILPAIQTTFKTDKRGVQEVLEGNVFLVATDCISAPDPSSHAGGLYLSSFYYQIYDVRGNEIAACGNICPKFNLVYYEEGAISGNDTVKIVVHELLHDFSNRFGINSDLEVANSFSKELISFIYNESSDQEFEKQMANAYRSVGSAFFGKFIDAFIEKTQSSLSETEKEELKKALAYRCELRFRIFPPDVPDFYRDSYASDGITDPEKQRRTYIAKEGYPILFEEGKIPKSLAVYYGRFVKEDVLKSRIIDNSYLSSEHRYEFENISRQFFNYLKDSQG